MNFKKPYIEALHRAKAVFFVSLHPLQYLPIPWKKSLNEKLEVTLELFSIEEISFNCNSGHMGHRKYVLLSILIYF